MGTSVKMRWIKSVGLITIAMFTAAACAGGVNSREDEGKKSDPEPWRQIMADDERFANPISEDDYDGYCSDARKSLVEEFSARDEDFYFGVVDGTSLCRGSIMANEDGDGPYITIEVSFDSLDGSRKEIAEAIDKHGSGVDECLLTEERPAYNADHDEGSGKQNELSGHKYCFYSVDKEDSSQGFARGAFIARDSVVSVSAKDIEPDTTFKESRSASLRAIEAVLPELLEKL